MSIFKDGKCSNNCFDKDHNPKGCHHCGNFANQFLRIDGEEARIGHTNVLAIIETARKRAGEAIDDDEK